MTLLKTIKQKQQRAKMRKSSSGFQLVFSDSIHLINQFDWQQIAQHASIFLSLNYLKGLEQNPPSNCQQKYAIAYDNAQPVAIFSCQLAHITGSHLLPTDNGIPELVTQKFKQRLLVCGNLVSSGQHGMAFSPNLDQATGWRIAAEVIQTIKRIEKLQDSIDGLLIKDIKGADSQDATTIEDYSFRKIETDPDMVLDLAPQLASFDDYLAQLTTKYRSRIKKMVKQLEQQGYSGEVVQLTPELETELHPLYLNVENKSKVRPASVPLGYFSSLQQQLGDNFRCIVIRKQQQIAGFMSFIKDGDQGVCYYVGLDYQVNADLPIYFRLFHLAIEQAISMGCSIVSMGRTALEPKANLGAKPVPIYVWARHGNSAVNLLVRPFFATIPVEQAPVRSVMKAG